MLCTWSDTDFTSWVDLLRVAPHTTHWKCPMWSSGKIHIVNWAIYNLLSHMLVFLASLSSTLTSFLQVLYSLWEHLSLHIQECIDLLLETLVPFRSPGFSSWHKSQILFMATPTAGTEVTFRAMCRKSIKAFIDFILNWGMVILENGS